MDHHTNIRCSLVLASVFLVAASAPATSYYFPKFGVPILVNDRLIFSGPGWESQRVICISAETGRKLWEISDLAKKLHPACAFEGQLILTAEGDVESLSPTNGTRRL